MPIFRNKVIVYLFTRYLTYGLQFIIALIIADRLGPYYLGVYGLLQLIINYFEQINFGIPHSLNVLLVHNKNNRKIQDSYTLNSLVIFSYINIIALGVTLFLYFKGGITWGDYKIHHYLLIIVFIAILCYYNSIFSIVVRFRNKVNILSLIGTIPVIANLVVIFFFREDNLVHALLVTNLCAYCINLFIFRLVGAIPRLRLGEISCKYQLTVVKKGIFLFLYNSCFYFILIGVRTLISKNYTIEEYGYFTFSYTIANAVLLLLASLNTIIFPKVIDMMSGDDLEEKKNALQKLRIGYITTANLLIYLALICFPLVTKIISKYEPALISMNLTALAVLMNTNSYGYISLLIAQNKEKQTSVISGIALIMSLVTGYILVYVFHIEFSYVVLSVMCGYLLFALLGYYYGNKELFGNSNLKKAIIDFFPLKFSLPYIVAVIISILNLENLIWIPLVIFSIMNYKDFNYLVIIIKKLVKQPNIIDVK